MPQTKVAVVIPTHKTELNPLEKISLAQCRKVLGHYPLIFVVPNDKNFSYLEPNDKFAFLPPQFFKSVRTYNQLMMFTEFYKMFSDYGYDYILIHELDAFVFSDKLEYFCNLGYDYIGAPWPMMYTKRIDGKRLRVGNSGFCLRNVKAHYNLLTEHADLVKSMMGKPNDVFYAYCGARDDCDFNVAPINIAYKFSAEYNPARVVKKNGGLLPFGCHDWNDHDPEFYIKTFRQFGYDLLPLKNLLNDVSISNRDLTTFLKNLAAHRLVRRIQRGQSIIRYLPTKRFASVRVIRSPQVMKVLGRLLDEDDHLADKVFIYTREEWPTLVSDLTLENLPHLILTLYGDDDLTEILEGHGFVYGKHFVSFRREYLNRCEELFRNLGK